MSQIYFGNYLTFYGNTLFSRLWAPSRNGLEGSRVRGKITSKIFCYNHYLAIIAAGRHVGGK